MILGMYHGSVYFIHATPPSKKKNQVQTYHSL